MKQSYVKCPVTFGEPVSVIREATTPIASLIRASFFWGTAFSEGFSPGSSAGKESACNAGHPSVIHGLGSSPGEGIGYSLQHSWTCLVGRMVKNPPRFYPWVGKIPWRREWSTHSSILAWRMLMDRRAWRAAIRGVAEAGRTERLRTARQPFPSSFTLSLSPICSLSGLQLPLLYCRRFCLVLNSAWNKKKTSVKMC